MLRNEHDARIKLFHHLDETFPKDALRFKHADYATAGIADFTYTWLGATTWWELKVNPKTLRIEGTELQRIRMQQLERQGFARYIFFGYDATMQSWVTYIIKPQHVGANGYFSFEVGAPDIRFDVVEVFIRATHNQYQSYLRGFHV